MTEITTDKLYKALKKTGDLSLYLEQNADKLIDEPVLSTHLELLLREKGVSRADVIKRGELDGSYGYQVFRGQKHPSRETVIQLAFGFALDLDGAQKLMKNAQVGILYARDRRDAVIMYGLNKGWSLDRTNAELDARGFKAVGNAE